MLRATPAVLDLNSILLFIACVSPIAVLARTARRAAVNRTWQLAALAVLAVTGVAYLIAPRFAGFIGGGAWVLFLLLPAVGLRKAAELAGAGRFPVARRIVTGLRLLHPSRVVCGEARILRALELAQRGETESALTLLAGIQPNDTRAGRQASAQTFRIRRDWECLLAWCRQNIPRIGLGEDPSLLLLYWRTLGETGQRDELVLQFAGRASALLASPVQQPIFLSGLMLLFAFTGRSAALQELFRTRLRSFNSDAMAFWIATSNADDHALVALHDTAANALVRGDITHRLAHPKTAPFSPLTRASEETIDRYERGLRRGSSSFLGAGGTRITPAVGALILLNVLMFGIEIASGGATNSFTLHRLGALEPSAVLLGHQYWRLGSALFLHYGAIHLLFNLYALYVLGPPLEDAIGTARFTVCYLLAGIGSSIGVVVLWRIGWTRADFLVGASGCVMGVVGAWAGWLLHHRHALLARRRLTSLAIIVIMQTAFDLYTPQVSMTAHLCGLVSGLVVGLLITPRTSKRSRAD
ncbi:MAG: rhomboid family intramembrane serine protease [Verrucomicrobiota bacterium]|nr:rhomboid family intramembrane serine protease [Verrucomicrobiota bacterium]